MIEGLPVNFHNVDRSALVVCVALLAVAACRRAITPMIAAPLRAIRRDVLVTVEAELWLRLARVGDMTVGALIFQFCMALDQWTWHH
jgi:hypothetical protein